MEMARIEAHGPRMMVEIPTPTACPVVPPGKGRLNIMMTKESAAITDNRGTSRVVRLFFTRRKAVYQKGAAAA